MRSQVEGECKRIEKSWGGSMSTTGLQIEATTREPILAWSTPPFFASAARSSVDGRQDPPNNFRRRPLMFS